MRNAEFYQRILRNPECITWKDILSECRVKHSKGSIERALQIGTGMDTATEADMLQKWRKPWVFFPVGKVGLSIVALLYIAIYVAFYLGGASNSLINMMTIIPPLIMPFVILVFIWELNIPRNISFYELLGAFLVGGILSFFVTGIMWSIIPNDESAALAAFREEPAKFLAALLILYLFSQKKKVYGITGLVIGAAVGAGFGGFESISYALMYSGNISGIMGNQILRGVYSLGGHTLMAALYMGAFACAMKGSQIRSQCFLNKDFIAMFASSTALHFIWNSSIFNNMLFETAKCIVIIIIFWILLLKMVRKCLYEVVRIGNRIGGIPNRNEGAVQRWTSVQYITVQCIKGNICGALWRSNGDNRLLVGRDSSCGLCFTGQAKGISRIHCSIQPSARGWTVKDLNSTYGTYLNGIKLKPQSEYVLNTGDTIALAGKECLLRIILQ